MNIDNSSKPNQEEFQEIDTTTIKPKIELKENVSLLDRGKASKKQSRPNSLSPSLSFNNKTNMTRDQIRYCGAIMRNLKKHRDAAPFLHPVDYVKLNVPDYPTVIKHPMDLSTVEKKLNNSEYVAVEEFINDIRLVFSNCYKFNGPEAMISMLCQNVESAFEKSLRQMPPSRGSSPLFMEEEQELKKRKKTNEVELFTSRDDIRPKRETHPPPSKDYPEQITKRRNPRKNDLQMKFCMQTIRELKKNKYRDINYPFLQPVDVVALNIPDYVNIIKRPMDISTIERKLNEGDYEDPEHFENDVRLMFNNCYTYNPPSLPVYKMGLALEKVFDEKWAQKPADVPLPSMADEEFEEQVVSKKKKKVQRESSEESSEESDNDDDQDDDDDDKRIAELERHIATISQQIANIKAQKKKKSDKTPVRRPAKEPSKRKRVIKKKAKKTTPKQVFDELPEFTFDQKKDLSERINNLTGDGLNTVVSIIQSSMPNLNGQGQEEIVLDIDSLDRRTLHRLHEFVTGESLIRKKVSSAKRARTEYSTSHKLERTLQKFNSDNDSSSDSESDSSSGSDSDDSSSSD